MLSSYCITVLIIAVCANIINASKSNELSEEEAFLAQMKAIPPTVFETYNNYVNDDSSYEQLQKRSTTEMSEGEAQRDIRSPLGTMRFGKRSPLGTTRFGKRNPLGTMRFGKRSPLGTMRFGKRDLTQYDFIKRNPLGTMRFGKRSAFVDF
uniref:Uncharacterized protein n=1 Tax=Panagrolaimus sp. ES5 TaxID=591445 RepID=A0AC34GRH6_9BILA